MVEVVVLALGCGLPALLVCASLSARGVPRLHLVGMVGLIGLAQACGGGIGSASGEWMFGQVRTLEPVLNVSWAYWTAAAMLVWSGRDLMRGKLTPEVSEPFTLRALVKLALWVGVAGLHAGVAVPLFALSPLVGMATIGCAAALLAGLGGLAGAAVTEAVSQRLLQVGGGVVIGMAVWLPVSQLFAATPS